MIKYSEMKDSGEELIGEIPSRWDSRPLKYVSELSGKKNDDGVTRKMLSVSQYHGIVEKEYESDDLRRSEEDSKTYWVVEDSNLVVNTMWLNYRGIGVSKGIEGYVSPAYRVYILNESKLIPRYTHYLMRSDLYVGIYTKHLKGIRPNSLQVSTYDFQHLIILIPPLEEQKRISKYLDQKTEQIDSLIEKIEKKIELLKEQRTSLINQCVTKGLDPNVEMKDSGIEWIGEIPSHWGVSRLCNLGSFSKAKNITKGDLVEEGLPVILYSHVYTTYDRTITNPVFFVSKSKYQESTLVRKGTVLFTSSGESVEEIGKTVLFRGSETAVGGDLVIFYINKQRIINLDFVSYVLNSDYVIHQKSSNSRGEIVVHIYEKQLRNIVISFPPLEEQKLISQYLDQKTEQIDSLVNSENQRIKLLKEYRQSLISSVVTGKVQVKEEMVIQ